MGGGRALAQNATPYVRRIIISRAVKVTGIRLDELQKENPKTDAALLLSLNFM